MLAKVLTPDDIPGSIEQLAVMYTLETVSTCLLACLLAECAFAVLQPIDEPDLAGRMRNNLMTWVHCWSSDTDLEQLDNGKGAGLC
jgi:hypothetical protein